MELKTEVALRKNKKLYKDGDKLIKLFDETYSKSGILNEALIQARVEETGLNIPTLHEVAKINNNWAIVMDFINGKTIEQLIDQNPEKQDEYLELFVKVQQEIHSKKAPLLNDINQKMKNKIDQTNLSSATKFDLHSRLAGLEKANNVLHGDYSLSNVIVCENGKVYVIDWAHSTQGNPAVDIAMSYLLLVMENKQELAEKYLDIFCEKANMKKHYIKNWVPVVAAAHLPGSKDEVANMLEKFINVIEFQ